MLVSRKRNYDFSDILDDQYTFELSEKDCRSLNGGNFCLAEIDFYTTSDDRYLESYIEDIDGGDNFADYCEDLFELLEEEGYWD